MTEHEPEGAAQRPDDETTAAVPPAAAPPSEPVQPPLVAWGAPPLPAAPPVAIVPDGFTVGAILSDAFARYAADPIRLVVVGIIPAAASLLGSTLAGPQPTTFAALGPYVATALVWSLLAAALGLASAAITFALLEVGPAGGFGVAIRWGLGRVGWLLAAGVLYGLAIFGVFLAFVVPMFILTAVLGGIAFLLVLVAIPVVLWIAIRLTLALPASVVDRLNAGQAIRIAWAVTKPSGVWWRVFGSTLVIGLLVGPVSILSTALTLMTTVPGPVATVIGAGLLAFVSPLSGSVQYSVYRRLVGPPPAAAAAAAAPRSTAAPPFGGAARAFVGVTIVLAVIGLVTLPLAMSTMLARQLQAQGLTFPGSVPTGTVAFGTSSALRTCTVLGQTTSAAAYSPIVYMGHFDRPATPTDEIRLRIVQDGTEIVNEVEKSGFYQCLGIDTPETDIGPGTYVFEMSLSGRVAARGTLVLH